MSLKFSMCSSTCTQWGGREGAKLCLALSVVLRLQGKITFIKTWILFYFVGVCLDHFLKHNTGVDISKSVMLAFEGITFTKCN
jgi:hypothetical protein